MNAPNGRKSLRHRAFYRLLRVTESDLVTLGAGCPWTICPRGLGESSIVYSAGVGGDVSFERALVEKFGCEVWLLDPSRVGIETMKRKENRHARMRFAPLALVGGGERREARARVAPDGYVSAAAAAADTGIVPAISLDRLMRLNGHSRIDLLKMDIEGFEYGVLEQILRDRIPVGQICVELHQRPHFAVPKFKKVEAILRLRQRGFALVHQSGYDHTFLNTAEASAAARRRLPER
jgi:FkbM family methyltransferase